MSVKLEKLSRDRFDEAVELVLSLDLDTKEEIEHHLEHLDAHYVALSGEEVVGVLGWYQDNVHYADTAMGDRFPGEEAYWVGFFAVRPDFQGKGVGKMLLDRVEKDVQQRGAKDFWVVSVPEAKTYYERHGFELVMEGEIGGKKKFFLRKVFE